MQNRLYWEMYHRSKFEFRLAAYLEFQNKKYYEFLFSFRLLVEFFFLWNAIVICTWSGRSLFKYRSRFWGIIWYAIILIQLMQCNNADAIVTIAVTIGFFFSGCHYFFLRRVRASSRVFYNWIIIDYVNKSTWIHIYIYQLKL